MSINPRKCKENVTFLRQIKQKRSCKDALARSLFIPFIRSLSGIAIDSAAIVFRHYGRVRS